MLCLFISSSINAVNNESGVIILQTSKEDLKLNLKICVTGLANTFNAWNILFILDLLCLNLET